MLKKIFIVASALIACVESVGITPPSVADIDIDEKLAEHFTKFVQFYGKHYSDFEEAKRFSIFKENVLKIQRLNSENDGAVYDINAFADLTSEEFEKSVLTKKLTDGPMDEIFTLPLFGKDDILNKYPILADDEKVRLSDQIPKAVDWRKTPCMAHIKDQAMCGSCWAFSTVNVLETAACAEMLANNVSPVMVEYSEQQLVDCDREQNEGCQGGLYHTAFQYIEKEGICKSNDYRYTGSSFSKCKVNNCKPTQSVKDIKRVARTVEDTKAAIAHAPVAIAMNASRLQFYRKGIFQGCSRTTQMDLNHAVNLVGYGFDEEAQLPYWILRNSWGTGWGQNGYAYVLMSELKDNEDLGMCGIHWAPVSIQPHKLHKNNLREQVYVA